MQPGFARLADSEMSAPTIAFQMPKLDSSLARSVSKRVRSASKVSRSVLPVRYRKQRLLAAADTVTVAQAQTEIQAKQQISASEAARATESDLASMRQAFQSMRGHFLVALNTQTQPAVVTQLIPPLAPVAAKPVIPVARKSEPKLLSNLEASVAKIPARKPATPPSTSLIQRDLQAASNLPAKAEAMPAPAPKAPLLASAKMDATTMSDTKPSTQLSIQPATGAWEKYKASIQRIVDPQTEAELEEAEADREQAQVEPVHTTRREGMGEGDAAVPVTIQKQGNAAPTTSAQIIIQDDTTKPLVMSSQRPSIIVRKVTNQSKAVYGPPAPAAAPSAKPVAVAATSTPAAASPMRVSSSEDEVDPNHSPALAALTAGDAGVVGFNTPQDYIVEAFEPGVDVSRSVVQVLSSEGDAKSSIRSWLEITAPDHWKTLAFWSSLAKRDIHVLSNNSAYLLGKVAGRGIQPGTGIVVGKVSAGWSVALESASPSAGGRTDAVIYLDKNHQPVSANDIIQDRYFAFTNVAPGAQLVTAVQALTGRSGSVGVPVLAGVSTFIDLSSVSYVPTQGRVLHAHEAEASGVPAVHVQAIGQAGGGVITNFRGQFNLGEITVFGDYPVYLETQSQTGYKHRYQYHLRRDLELSLFQFHEEDIQIWVGQLNGGVSPESGLLVAAIPDVMSKHADETLYPTVYSLHEHVTLETETYPVSSEGQLQVNHPIEAESGRFVAVQIPEGFLNARIDNEHRDAVWSRLFVASPGVVNVISP